MKTRNFSLIRVLSAGVEIVLNISIEYGGIEWWMDAQYPAEIVNLQIMKKNNNNLGTKFIRF